MASIMQLGLRGLQFLWTLLIMALVGNMIHDAFNGNPSIVNYVMFTAVFAMLSLFYLVAAAINEAYSIAPMFVVLVDALNVLIFFCGAVALAAYLGAHSCTNGDYTRSNKITNGAYNSKKRCQEAQAVTAFLWFGFASFVASLVLSFFSAKGSTTPRPSIVRRGGSSGLGSHADERSCRRLIASVISLFIAVFR